MALPTPTEWMQEDPATADCSDRMSSDTHLRPPTVQNGVPPPAESSVGESRLELLGPLGEDTPVGRFLATRGPGMHHVAYEVDDIRAALAHLSGEGAELIDVTPRRGMFGLEVAFVHPDSVHGVLSEVVAVG